MNLIVGIQSTLPFGLENNNPSKGLILTIAKDKDQKYLANKIVMDFHSYVKSPRTVGRCIKYLIEYNNELVGTFWLGSGFKPTPKSILNHMKMSQKEFDQIFNEVADNKRFCMAKSIPNLGSQVLKEVRRRAKADWMSIYGNNLRAIVTTIGSDKRGSVYLADNWIKIGETAGLPSDRKSVSMKWDDAEGIKAKYSKPTGENKKTILITQKL